MKQLKYTITDLRADFPDDAACLKWLADYLYPDGIHCIKCNKVTPHHQMKTRRSFSCEMCGHHVHPTAGTIFEKSSTPLTLWFEAIYLITATRAGISAKQLERTLGVTYKTAWRMFHQIRKMMADDGSILNKDVEVDEMYLHPDPQKRSTASNKRRGNEQIVFGMVERGGKAIVKHVKSSGTRVLVPQIIQHVGKTAVVYSDDFRSYHSLKKAGYEHKTINHSLSHYVDGSTHTQNVENLWSNTKRGIKGVYRHVDPEYLQAYIDEYAFRYSHRHHYMPMFWALMMKVEKA